MLTLFTTAKPFVGHNGIIQRNALKSWKLLGRGVEVILFGDDEGAPEVARELKLRHEARVERSAQGTKRLDYLFERAQTLAQHEIVCYCNCDILLMDDFRRAVQQVALAREKFLMVGRRWDVNIAKEYAFEREDWQEELRSAALRSARQRGPEWIDYFVFRRGLYKGNMPPMVLGRVHWDNWLVWKAQKEGCAVVDASAAVVAAHQHHDYGYHPWGKQGVWNDEEAGNNYRLAGGWRHLRTIADADEVLPAVRLRANHARYLAAAKRYARQAGRTLRHQVAERAWFWILEITRPVRTAAGLRSGKAQQKAAAIPVDAVEPVPQMNYANRAFRRRNGSSKYFLER